MIIVTADEWRKLNLELDKDSIKRLIIRRIRACDLPLPLFGPSLEDAQKAFNRLKDSDSESLIKHDSWVTRYDYKYDSLNTYIDNSKLGGAASNYFHFDDRMNCDSINSPSPNRVWDNDKFMFTLLNFLWSSFLKDGEDITVKTMAMAISLRKYIASQYRPSIAKCIYDMYAPAGGRVLDFSSGWGDRLLGFHASKCSSYVGVDPNVNLVDNYAKQNEFYNTGKSVEMICAQAEKVSLSGEFDLVFTSPPYFQIERYTRDATQSYKEYKKLDGWLEGFLYPALSNSWNHLKVGGKMIINISDVYCYHQIQNICDPMNDHISSLSGAKYLGAIGMRMSKRPNTKASKTGIFCEPMWMFEKEAG